MFALIDCNNFFVSCERVFQPELQNKPVLVLSSNDGCVIARSQETKDLGIPMSIPLFKIKYLVKQHSIFLRSTNFKLYRDMSSRVMQVIKSISGSIEVYSIDEAFIEIPKDESPFLFCKRIREQVLLQTGIPVSIGIAPTKTLAKLANKKAKERKTSHIFIFNFQKSNKILYILRQTSVGEIWGIGRGLSQRLTSKGILNVYQLISLHNHVIKSLFGVIGVRMVNELRGTTMYAFNQKSDPKKSITSSRSFGKILYSKEDLWNSLAYHIDHIARELRQAHQVTQCLRIGIYTNRFGSEKYNSKRDTQILTRPTNNTGELLQVAQNILDSIYQPKIAYSKSGVAVSFLSSDQFVFSATLFETTQDIESKNLDELVDTLDQKYGVGAVMLGTLFTPLHTDEWLPKAQMKSSEFTTSWNQILTIKKRVY